MGRTGLRGVTCPTHFIREKRVLDDVETGERMQNLLNDGEPFKNASRCLKTDRVQ
jgi:tRNA 2-thiouridine synthesizing protein A